MNDRREDLNVSSHRDDRHLSAEALQGLLDGTLPEGETDRVQEHVDACARCRSELEGWEVLFHGLDELEEVDPAPDFSERVMMALPRDPVPAGILGRSLTWLGLREPPRVRGHLTAARAQDFLENVLPRPQSEAVEEHLHSCRFCREEVDQWRAVMVRLDGVPRLAPPPEFSERVMAHVRISTAVAVARPTARERLARLAQSVAPATRRRLAALAGAAITPAVTVALVAWTVFSHPLVTVGSLASYARLELQDVLAGLAGALGWETVQSTVFARGLAVFEMASGAPGIAFLGFALLCGLTLTAVWVLYRNLFTTHAVDGHYAH